ncbi:VWA domain-containing protein [Methanolobus sp.]|uniref:vWA domain-containing protein n=1 Tax=Methanolobus sp. TaxID=1874737 RepID=UPI0025DE8A6C|nr:VWA domain-containing protein [Methanolobus sp.]
MNSGDHAQRLRRNLLRNYGVKVMHLGAAVLGLRIPRESVADISKKDTDTLYGILQYNFEQVRPDEISVIYIIADSDHLEMEPLQFFEPLLGSIGNAQLELPLIQAGDNPAVFLDEKDAFIEDTSSLFYSGGQVLVELTPKEYLPGNKGEEGTEPAFILASDIEVHRELQEDKKVGKIMNDFARNSPKKRLASGRLKSGRRAEVLTKSKRGRYVRYRMPGEKINDIAIAPTLRAAALHAKDGKLEIMSGDIREKVRRRRISSLITVVFDTSGSMDEQDKIMITKGVVIALLKDAYQRRDRVSLVTYSGRSSQLVLPFTSSVEAAKRYLEKVPFGGTTPMAAGVLTGMDTILREVKKEPSAVPIMVLVTDGTANCALHLGGNIRREILQVCRHIAEHHINLLLIDISPTGSKLVQEMATQSNGSYYHPGSLSKEALYSVIRQERDSRTDFALV